MKLHELLIEMPIFKHEVLKDQMHRPFTTDKALERRFDIVNVGKTQFGDSYGVFISKRHDFAVIGIPGIRESDGENGIDVIGTVNFKTPMINGFGLIDISNLSQVLQVSLVHVAAEQQDRGWAMYLYASLIKAGFIVISDNTQYIGGKELWKKIARNSLDGKYSVYVIDQGKVRMNGDIPLKYDGINIDDSELWSENSDELIHH